MPLPSAIKMLCNAHCALGENPLWNERDGCLYWTDITGGEVHRFHLENGRHEVIYTGSPVGGFTFQENDDLLLFRMEDVALLRTDGQVEVMRPFKDEGMARFNDVIADPQGRVFAGTIGTTETSGGLYRVETDGSIELLFRGTGVSNGMGFSPDLKIFYWTCSTRRRIYAFDYDADTGSLTREHILYQATDAEGIPDGMTVDAQGDIWSTRWDGHALKHHAPDGKVIETIEFPVVKVSSVCFGGANLDTLFCTSAGGSAEGESLDGAVFQLPASQRGRLEFRSKIQLQSQDLK